MNCRSREPRVQIGALCLNEQTGAEANCKRLQTPTRTIPGGTQPWPTPHAKPQIFAPRSIQRWLCCHRCSRPGTKANEQRRRCREMRSVCAWPHAGLQSAMSSTVCSKRCRQPAIEHPFWLPCRQLVGDVQGRAPIHGVARAAKVAVGGIDLLRIACWPKDIGAAHGSDAANASCCVKAHQHTAHVRAPAA